MYWHIYSELLGHGQIHFNLGIRTERFWALCDELDQTSCSTLIPMAPPLYTMLFRTKLRHGLSDYILSLFFGISERSVNEYFLITAINVNIRFHTIPPIWTKVSFWPTLIDRIYNSLEFVQIGVTLEELNHAFASINHNNDPFYERLRGFFADPSGGNRVACFINLDSTKVRVPKFSGILVLFWDFVLFSSSTFLF